MEKTTDDWTPSLIDRLNEFARENRSEFQEINTGSEASFMIQEIHGRYNHMRIALDKIMSLDKERSAFPHESGLYSHGMTLRDYFAAKAMQGLLAKFALPSIIPTELVASVAYNTADAMLKARDEK